MAQTKKSYVLLLLLGINIWIFFQSLHQTNSDLEDPISNISTIEKGSIINKLTGFQTYTPHAPIFINDNSDFATLGFNGSGTVADPYRIEGLNITSALCTLITIRNTNVYFEINDNLLDGLGCGPSGTDGIFLADVIHGTIQGNIIRQMGGGAILLHRSSQIMIRNNTVFDNQNGIGIGVSSNNNTISNNTLYNHLVQHYEIHDSDNNIFNSAGA